MKKAAVFLAAMLTAAPAFAGNVEVFEEEVVVVEEEPAPAGSAAGWVVPLLAVVIAGAAIAISQSD